MAWFVSAGDPVYTEDFAAALAEGLSVGNAFGMAGWLPESPAVASLPDGTVVPIPPTTRLLRVDGRGIVGAVEIRHSLDSALAAAYAGHISLGMRPSRMGNVASLAYSMAVATLGEAAVIGIERAMCVCRKDNRRAWDSLERLGGIYMDEVPAVYSPSRYLLRRYVVPTAPYRHLAREAAVVT